MNTNRHEFVPESKTQAFETNVSALSAVIDRRHRSAIFSTIDFSSASVRQLPFLRRAAPVAPALFSRAQVLQALQTQLPRGRWRPVFYFS